MHAIDLDSFALLHTAQIRRMFQNTPPNKFDRYDLSGRVFPSSLPSCPLICAATSCRMLGTRDSLLPSNPQGESPPIVCVYTSVNRVDEEQATREIARFMSEPYEGAWNMLKQQIRNLVGHGTLVHVISEQMRHAWIQTAILQDACSVERERQELVFFTASNYSMLKVGRKVHDV